MPLISFPPDVVEENIKDHRRRVELGDVQATNKRLRTEEAGFVDRLETANNDAQRHEIWLEKVKSDLKKAKEEKQASTQAVTVHEHALTTFRQTMQSSNIDMAAIPQLKTMIVENEDLLKKQLGDAIARLYDIIEDSATIGSKLDNSSKWTSARRMPRQGSGNIQHIHDPIRFGYNSRSQAQQSWCEERYQEST